MLICLRCLCRMALSNLACSMSRKANNLYINNWWTPLFSILLYYIILYYIILYPIILYHIISHYILLLVPLTWVLWSCLCVLSRLLVDVDGRRPSRGSLCSPVSLLKGQQSVGKCSWFVDNHWCHRWLLMFVVWNCLDCKGQTHHQPVVRFDASFYQTSPRREQ